MKLGVLLPRHRPNTGHYRHDLMVHFTFHQFNRHYRFFRLIVQRITVSMRRHIIRINTRLVRRTLTLAIRRTQHLATARRAKSRQARAIDNSTNGHRHRFNTNLTNKRNLNRITSSRRTTIANLSLKRPHNVFHRLVTTNHGRFDNGSLLTRKQLRGHRH